MRSSARRSLCRPSSRRRSRASRRAQGAGLRRRGEWLPQLDLQGGFRCGSWQIPEEIDDQLIAAVRAVRLGMELDAEHGTLAMAHGHDHAIVGLRLDREAVGQRDPLDDQRVVARSPHGRRAAFEQPAARVAYFTDLAVYGDAIADYPPAVCLADGLMAETDTEKRHGLVGSDQIDDT